MISYRYEKTKASDLLPYCLAKLECLTVVSFTSARIICAVYKMR